RLKATSDRDLTVGGPHLAAAMLAANLVDELHAFVSPIIIGGGNRWLPRDLRVPLELVGERRLGGARHPRPPRGSSSTPAGALSIMPLQLTTTGARPEGARRRFGAPPAHGPPLLRQ